VAEPERRSALHAHVHAGTIGRAGAGVTLAERRPRALLMLHGAPEPELGAVLADAAPAPAAGRQFAAAQARFLWTGPGQWLVVAETRDVGALREALESALGGTDATLTDLSHARTVVRVGGPRAADTLLAGCPLDLEAMAPGACGASVLGPFSVTVHRHEAGFDVYVFRTFGLALWEWLLEAGAEHGVEIVAPEP